MKSFLRKILSFALAALCALSLFSCSKKEEVKKTEEVPATTLAPLVFDDYDYAEEIELLDNIDTWLGYGDTGFVEEKGSFEITVINNRKELDPYRKYIFDLSEKEENKMFNDIGGRIFLIEFTSDNEYTLFSSDTIQKYGSSLILGVSKLEDTEPTDPHTFFLLHIPSSVYEGESLEIVFS